MKNSLNLVKSSQVLNNFFSASDTMEANKTRKGKILQNFVAFSEYMNFNNIFLDYNW